MNTPASKSPTRCAIYTRKSSDEGLEQSFNSLDAQRESAENFVASRRHEGWVALPDRYDDGGYSGGNTNRPGLQRLLKDIEAGRIDLVTIYKIDRLSRSLADFCKLAELFDKHAVSVVSISQPFDTSTSTGRLMLHMLMAFGEFERQLASERTRDKIAAARKRGKWAGGRPLLGYDIDRAHCRLVVNESEAMQVREAFTVYIERQSLARTVETLAARGITNKRWVTKAGAVMGGRPFDKQALSMLLGNVAFLGKVTHKTATYDGEHPAIVEQAVWERAQSILRVNAHSGGSKVRNLSGALLKGLLMCGPCGCPMTHTFTTKRDGRAYRYYCCRAAQDKGWQSCSSKSVPAEEIDRFVLARLKGLGRDRELVALVLDHLGRRDRERLADLEAERRTVEQDAAWLAKATDAAATAVPSDADRLVELAERGRDLAVRGSRLDREHEVIRARQKSHAQVAGAMTKFDPLWESLSPKERAELVSLLVQRVTFDGTKGEVKITFHPDAPITLERIKESVL